jgi:hypothetical protein
MLTLFTFVNRYSAREEIIMSSSNSSTANDSHQYRHSQSNCCRKGNWSFMNIVAMVVGFILFWPVGLFLLFWNISGRDVKDLPSAIQEKVSSMFNGSFFSSKSPKDSADKNSVFEEYQQTQYDRITEIKEEIKERGRRFRNFRSEAKRRADESEFKEFMSSDQSKPNK